MPIEPDDRAKLEELAGPHAPHVNRAMFPVDRHVAVLARAVLALDDEE